MKKLFFALAFITLQLVAIAQTYSPKDLIGKWEGTDYTNETGSLEFIDSIHVIMSVPGMNAVTTTYYVDFSKTPIWFDIIIGSTDNNIKMKSFLQFESTDSMKWQFLNGEDRPDKWQPETGDNTLLLKRKKTEPGKTGN